MSTAGLPGDRLANRTHPVEAEDVAAMAGAATETPEPSAAARTAPRARILRSLTVSSPLRSTPGRARTRAVTRQEIQPGRGARAANPGPRRALLAHTVLATVAAGNSRAHRAGPVQPERAVESD